MTLRAKVWTSAFEDMRRVGAHAVSVGLALASGGNLSVRRPGSSEFVVTGRGTFLDRLGPESFALMNLDGDVLDGTEPSSEWKLHQRTYRARPEINAIVHLHPAHVVLLDALGKRIRLLTLDHVSYLPVINRIPFYPNGSDELADAAAGASIDCDCIVLGNHGCSTLSTTVEDAFRKALNLESAATATYRMLLLGDETTEFPRHLRATAIHG
ncbi:L-fuculose-phosphate aldolase [Antricoccus suffuscus]|uniref:L-fuculose-phosphate aldolase n=1 Tax=Antricoccus suffuscus TaxID=1629062 RepID=A0A2T0Z1G9_9ACTN|nr:class II aldolase/adducin family protein [Antricoccus suffuscus]PRZ30180.1 L-fuculose-phosphate aldolase [Antricoccus suffuscus]